MFLLIIGAAVCVVGVAVEVVGVAGEYRLMVKVTPKNKRKSIQQQNQIKESRSTLKRTFNACVKWKEKQNKNCFENIISITRGCVINIKENCCLKKSKIFFFSRSLEKIYENNLRQIKKNQSKNISKQLLYLKKVFVIQQKL